MPNSSNLFFCSDFGQIMHCMREMMRQILKQNSVLCPVIVQYLALEYWLTVCIVKRWLHLRQTIQIHASILGAHYLNLSFQLIILFYYLNFLSELIIISHFFWTRDVISQDDVSSVSVRFQASQQIFLNKTVSFISNYSAFYNSVVCYSGLIGTKIKRTIICYD